MPQCAGRTCFPLRGPTVVQEGLVRVGPCFVDFPRDAPQHTCEFPDRLIFSLPIFSLWFIPV